MSELAHPIDGIKLGRDLKTLTLLPPSSQSDRAKSTDGPASVISLEANSRSPSDILSRVAGTNRASEMGGSEFNLGKNDRDFP